MRFKKMSEFVKFAEEVIRETNKKSVVKIAGIKFDVVDILKKLDPVAYRCTILDIADAENVDLDKLEEDEDFWSSLFKKNERKKKWN